MGQHKLGHWVRYCDCKGERRYWASCAPTAADRMAYHQLTGKSVPEVDGAWNPLYGYGSLRNG